MVPIPMLVVIGNKCRNIQRIQILGVTCCERRRRGTGMSNIIISTVIAVRELMGDGYPLCVYLCICIFFFLSVVEIKKKKILNLKMLL